MNSPVLTFVNNRDGAGKASLIYHLAWMLTSLNKRVIADELSTAWHHCLTHPDQHALRVFTALSQILQWAAADIQPDLLLVDLGPGLGALNRSGLFATDYIAIPLDSAPVSLHGLRPLGAALKNWKQSWQTQAGRCPHVGKMQPIGYLYQQQSLRPDRQMQVVETWASQIPGVYRESLLDLPRVQGITPASDPECIGMVKNFRSLNQMAKEKRKPMFCLTPADGAIGCHASAAVDAEKHFRQLARQVAARSGVEI